MKETGNQETERSPCERDLPACFGDPEAVCPRDERGFIEPQAECLSCTAVKSCLQRALQLQGILPEPVKDTPVGSKLTGFLKRWSNQKLSRSGSSGNSGPS